MKKISKNQLFILPVLLFFISCHNDKKSINSDETNGNSLKTFDSLSYSAKYLNDEKLQDLKNDIFSNGDTISYNKLEDIYFQSEHQKEFLYYSLYMSLNYNYPKSYYTCFLIMDINSEKESKKMGIYYLLKSYELGYRLAEYELEGIFANGIIPRSDIYLKSLQN